MKILNLYAGIGGNRKLWGDEHQVTAIELDPKIANVYSALFPDDIVIIGDAHQYLLDHYEEYDFIWSSPPCPTHSQMGRLRAYAKSGVNSGQYSPAKYPDMKLYEEILLLQHYYKGKYVVENVTSYYKPLIPPQKLDRHYYWANFNISPISLGSDNIARGSVQEWSEKFGYNLNDLKGLDKRKVLRNCVNPVMGNHILDQSTTV